MIKTWWNKRVKREQTMLLTLVAVLIGVLIYTLIPTGTQQTSTANWQQQQKELKQVAQLAEQISNLRQRGAQLKHPITLLSIQQNLNHAGLDHYVNETDMGTHRITLQFKSVPFDDLAQWLTELTQSTTTHIESWETKRGASPGLVDSRIVLII